LPVAVREERVETERQKIKNKPAGKKHTKQMVNRLEWYERNESTIRLIKAENIMKNVFQHKNKRIQFLDKIRENHF
jgi:hypothetical protein